MLTERPNSLCHRALLRAQLSPQRLQWRAATRNQRELMHKPELWRSIVIFVHLICKLPGYKKAGRKGDVTAWIYAMCAFDIFELLKRWKRNSLVAGENM